MGIVEREKARLDFGNRETRNGAGEFRRHHKLFGFALFLLVGELRDHQTIGEIERGLDGIGQAVADVLLHHDAIDHDFDVVFQLLVESGDFADVVELPVHLDALEALLLKLCEFLAVFALAAAHDGREQEQARAFVERENAVRHLADGLAFDGKAGCGRIGNADAREQQAQIIVDFGDGADRRTRIPRRGFLLDGDGGREALDVIHIGLLHQFQELARIGGKRFHIAALAFGIDRVEGEQDLPEPERPVRTVSVSRGISTSMFLRLCSRAPRMEMFFSKVHAFSVLLPHG